MMKIPGGRRLHRLSIGASLGVLLSASAAQAADLNGHWRLTSSNLRFEVVHTGDTVTLVRASDACTGTIDGSNVELTCTNPGTYSLVLSGDESTLAGIHETFQCVFSSCQTLDIPVTFERCECFDANGLDGDGCDLECKVEECYECSGDPSTCTPLADTTPCEHPSFCISGGTCSAGTCEGGTETAASCLDLSGSWLRADRMVEPMLGGPTVLRTTFRHDADGSLRIHSVPDGYLNWSGSVDAEALTFTLPGYGSFPFCGRGDLDAIIAPDGNRYTATGMSMAATPRFCLGFPYDEFGIRCAPPSLEPADGCRVDSCERCEGDPAVCEALPDWTPCMPEDSCAIVSACQQGQCVAAFQANTFECAPGGPSSVCSSVPMEDCRSASTKLLIKSPAEGGNRSMRWDWKKGGLVDLLDLGFPSNFSRVSICLYDQSAPSNPVLIHHDSVNHYDLEPGWTKDARGNVRFRSETRSITSISLRAGSRARMNLKAGPLSFELPVPELPLPLRVQLQIQDAGCFEGSYGAADVRKNENGVFKGASTPSP